MVPSPLSSLNQVLNDCTLYLHLAWPNYGLDVLNITHAYRSGNTFPWVHIHLMKYHLLQGEVVKVKFLMNSNMILTVLNLHQKTDPKVQQDFKGQGHYDKVKGQIKVTP